MLNTERLCMGCMNDNGGEKVCPICGYDSSTKNERDFLPVKTWIRGRYLIGKVIESDGEGVTYIGWDNEENNIINIREFFPIGLANRGENGSVHISQGEDYRFNTALMDFLQLHKTLKEIDIAALCPITEIIECNATAYVITATVSSIPLREFLLRNGGTLSWEQARPLFMPLITAIISLHKAGIIHGGISPETIMVGRDGKLRLSGFSISQLRVIDSSLNAQLFPGYAAAEQYGLTGEATLNQSSDVYGFASTMFRCLMGSALPAADERITDDKMSIPAKIAEALPKALLVTLADALQIIPANRTATMEDLKLDIAPAADATTGIVAPVPQKKTGKPVKSAEKKKKSNSSTKYIFISAGITAGIFLLISVLLVLLLGNPFAKDPTPSSSDEIPFSSSESIQEETSSTSSPSGEKLLTLPDFSAQNMTFDQICKEYADFKFVVLGKKYSSKGAGIVTGQDIPAGSQVKRETTVKLTISLGPETILIPNLKGLTKDQATVQLFIDGFLYNNITFYEIEDDSVPYNCVVKTDPAVDATVSPDTPITVYISNVKTISSEIVE